MQFIGISDTHEGRWENFPDADLVIHAGDATFRGREDERKLFIDWYSKLSHKYKIYVAGNHDIGMNDDDFKKELAKNNIIYLEDSSVTIEGHVIYGSPWTPTFGHGWAFNADRGSEIKAIWDKIPNNVGILATHGPPYGILDDTNHTGIRDFGGVSNHVGCKDLLDAINRVKPGAHVFGHIHEGAGYFIREDGMVCINASQRDEYYNRLGGTPIVWEIDDVTGAVVPYIEVV